MVICPKKRPPVVFTLIHIIGRFYWNIPTKNKILPNLPCNKLSKTSFNNRISKKLTQDEVAHALNVKRETVTRWETGARDIKTEITILLSKYFNVSADYLLGLTENTSTNISEIGISNKTGFSTSTVENILDLPIKLKIILDKIINELLKSDLLEKFEELKENNIKLINLYQTDSIYNKLVEDEELTYNTIDNADELNGKFIFKDEYSKLLLFEIKYILFDIIRNLSDYNKMIELKKDSENDED